MSVQFLALLVIAAAIVAFVLLGRGELLRFETTAASQEVINGAISQVGTKRRWSALSTSEAAATFGYHKKPSKLIAFVLLLCFVVPGIIYLVLAGKKESLAVTTSPQSGAGTSVQVASNGWRGKGAGRALRSQLGVAPEAASARTVALPEGTPVLEATQTDPTSTGISAGQS